MKKIKLVDIIAGALLTLGIGSCSANTDKPEETYELVIQYPALEEDNSTNPKSVYLRRESDAKLLWDNYLSSTNILSVEREYADPELEEVLGGKLKLRIVGEPRCPPLVTPVTLYSLQLVPMSAHPEIPEAVEITSAKNPIGKFELSSICYDGSRPTGYYNDSGSFEKRVYYSDSGSFEERVLTFPLFHHIALGLKPNEDLKTDRCEFRFLSDGKETLSFEVLLSPKVIDAYRQRRAYYEHWECSGCRNYQGK